jgi:hypothetical protein
MNHLFASYHKNIAMDSAIDGNHFSARPIKEWRKQYQNSSVGYSRASIGMPMDRPGGIIPVASSTIQCSTCRGSIPAKVETINDSDCYKCKKIINNTNFSDNAYNDTSAYLQSRCATYNQNVSAERVSSINYFSNEGIPIEPSDSPNGTQVRKTSNCYSYKPPRVCNTTIYKPNNVQYAQQGGVSSSSRISRLKYNTLNNNGAEYSSALSAMNTNSGLYQTEPSPSYYVKNKPQKVIFPHRNGARTHCITNSTCMF